MIELAKPGGYIVTQEPNHAPWTFIPEIPSWPRLINICEKAIAFRGDINIGRKTYHLLRRSGLEDVSVRPAVIALKNKHPYMKMIVTAVRAMKEEIVANMLATSDEIEQMLDDVELAADDADGLHITYAMMQVWGRKPN